jgi:cold shock CspA family protein
VFFHSSAIFGEAIDNLREGDGVEFELGDGGAKGPRATSVRRTTT